MKRNAMPAANPPPTRFTAHSAEFLWRASGFTPSFLRWMGLAGVLLTLEVVGLSLSFCLGFLMRASVPNRYRLTLSLLLAAIVIGAIVAALGGFCVIKAARALRNMERLAKGEP